MSFPVPRGRSGGDEAFRRGQPGADALADEEALLAQAGLPWLHLERVKSLARRWGVTPRQAALATGVVRPRDYLRALAMACGLDPRQVNDGAAPRLLGEVPEPHKLVSSRQPIPLDTPRNGVAVNGEDLQPDIVGQIAGALGPAKGRLVLMTRSGLSAAIAERHGAHLAGEASRGLHNRNPRLSAATGLISWQIACLAVMAGLFLGAAVFAPREAVAVYGAALSLMFLLTISIRLAAAIHVFHRRFLGRRTRYQRLPDADLPSYSVLVAMFREARVLPQLAAALKALDYPPAKLDIKLVLEAVDAETIAAARALKLPAHFEIVIVPDGAPRTKPRALNYALQFARGDYLVIYDAEDRPDPYQLRKAAAHFRDAPSDVVCLQGRLTFDNSRETWLAKQFTIEYASLFGGILPMLDKARLPIPLGGTSNHFRAGVLRKLGGWDAYNVTEDADLGMRIYRAGLRAEVLDSATFEEAACHPGNWLRQRTRWLKGWMQTYFVHMRQPRRLMRELGLRGFLALQGHFGGIIIAALVHPWSYVLIAHDAIAGHLFAPPGTILGTQIWAIALFNLIAGYAASLALGFFVLQERRIRFLLPQLPFLPLYWLFISAAAYRAVYQLIVAPHHWEKTEHGVTKVRRAGGEPQAYPS
jgi:cellulose synthase/poly-beta-1,6-N-acetylglucosamine synthase-like glycosyltransferase